MLHSSLLGTGKTALLVEAVRQIVKKTTDRILICAPSNSAADLFAKQLLQVGRLSPDEVLRLYSRSQQVKDMIDGLEKSVHIV